MHTKPNPCKECPFLKTSLRGYIGGHNHISEITDIVMNDQKFPCHIEVNKLCNDMKHSDDIGDDLDSDNTLNRAAEDAAYYTGALAMMNNTAKLSRDKRVSNLQKTIGKREDVFRNRYEMEAYHMAPLKPVKKRSK